jgi:HEAT repeat protein
MDQNTWVCQLMRCLGVVVHNTPFRCLPREQLLALMQSIWERYALSVGPETETLRAAALSCLKHIHMRLGTLPPLHLFLADRARWTDSHVLSFVEAMLTMRIRLGESRHQVAAEDDLLDDLLRQLIRTHLEGSTTPPAMRLQAARLLRLKLRLHSSPAKADDVLVRRLLQDSFHAVRAVAVECLSQNGIEMISPAIFSELKAQASDSTASMRAAACTTLGRMLLSDSVSESFSTDGDAALISGTDDLRRRVMELLVQRLLSDPNIHVRAAVAATLGNLCSKEGSLSHFLPESAISKAVEELDRAPYSSHASAYCRFLATVMPDETQRLDIVSMIGRILQGARRKQLRYQAALALAKHLRKTDDVTLWSLVKRYGSQQQSP